MKEDYRTKLANWLISMLLLIAGLAASLCLSWFNTFSAIDMTGDTEVFAYKAAGPLGEVFAMFPWIFLPTFCWHFSDFITAKSAKSVRLQSLIQFRWFFRLLLTLTVMTVLIASDWFLNVGSCGGMFRIMSQACVWTNPVLLVPWEAVLAALWLLALLKLAVALWSRLGRQR